MTHGNLRGAVLTSSNARPEEPVEFPPTNGRFSGWFGVGLAGVLAVGSLADGWQSRDAPVLVALLLGALVSWLVLLRPLVSVDGGDLVLRNMLSTTRIPLASVDELQVRHLFTVLADGRRFQSTALNRRREGVLRTALQSRQPSTGPTPVPTYVDVVEARLNRLVDEARAAAGDGPPAAVRRSWAVPETLALAALTTLLVVLLAV